MNYGTGKEEERDEPTDEELLEAEEISSEEEAFIRGYDDKEEVVTCDQCGTAIRGKKIKKKIEGEPYKFCSEACAKEFEEEMG